MKIHKQNHAISMEPVEAPSGPPLLVKGKVVCDMLGGIHPRSLARLEQRGLIKAVPLLRHKLYAVSDVNKLVADLREWQP